MNDTTRELGGALGVAVLGSLVTSSYTSAIGEHLGGITGPERSLAESGMTGAFAVADRLGAGGDQLAEAARHAFVGGMHVAALTGAIVVLFAAVAARRLLPRTFEPIVVQGLADDEVLVDAGVLDGARLEPA